MFEKKLSREEVAIDLPPPWLIYAKQLTKEEIQLLIDGKAIELNLYVVNDTYIRVTLFGEEKDEHICDFRMSLDGGTLVCKCGAWK